MVPATVEIRNLPPTTMVVDPPRAEKGIPARIEVRGPRPLVEQLRNTFNKLDVDYPPHAPRKFTTVVDPSQLQLPSGVEILSVDPATVTIQTEQVVGKQLQVVVDTVGAPAAGFKLGEIKVIPETVVVRGPQSIVEKLRRIETFPLELKGVEAPIRKELSLKVPGQLVTLNVTVVTVEAKVEPKENKENLVAK